MRCAAQCAVLWSQAVVWGRAGPSGVQALILPCFIMTSFPSRNRRTPCCLLMCSLSLVSGHCRKRGRRCSPRSWWHVVPGATLPWVTDLSVRVPPRALRRGGQYTLQVLCCDVWRCQAAEAGPKYRNACVVCPCERGHAPHWDFYALYDTVALYVSREFTVPELQLF